MVSGGRYVPGYGWVIDGDPPAPPPSSGGGDYSFDPGTGGGSHGSDPNSGDRVEGVSVVGVDCQGEFSQINKALDYLRIGSPTAAKILDDALSQMRSFNNSINLINNHKDFSYPDGNVDWDPYSSVQFYDANGNVVGNQSAAVGLIHELTHRLNVYKTQAVSDAEATRIEQIVVQELNAHYGNNTEFARSHHGQHATEYWSASSTENSGYGADFNKRPEPCS